MKIVTGVRFKKPGKIYYFNPENLELEKGMNVIVDTAMGDEFGEVVIPKKEVEACVQGVVCLGDLQCGVCCSVEHLPVGDQAFLFQLQCA